MGRIINQKYFIWMMCYYIYTCIKIFLPFPRSDRRAIIFIIYGAINHEIARRSALLRANPRSGPGDLGPPNGDEEAGQSISSETEHPVPCSAARDHPTRREEINPGLWQTSSRPSSLLTRKKSKVDPDRGRRAMGDQPHDVEDIGWV